MNKIKFTEEEDKLLITLRDKKVPFKEIVEFFPNRTLDSLRCRNFNLRKDNQDWEKQETIGFLDLETSSFEADTGFILSYCLKICGGEIYEGVVNKKEIFSGKFDYRLVKELIRLIVEKVDIVVGYYSTGFDIPFLRSRAIYHGIDFPKYKDKYHFDVYYRARSLLKLHRNSLDSVTAFLGIPGKNHVDLKIWNLAKIGDKQSLDYVLEHNRQDVIILEKLFNKLDGYRKWTRKSL